MTALRHIVLVGLPGSGKSTVAPLLGARLSRPAVDTDAVVEARLGMDIARLFAESGEARFRVEEREALTQALRSPEPLVIAAGGGLVAQPGVLDVLAREATVVLLDAADAELAARLGPGAPGRPLLADGAATALAGLRTARLEAHSHAQLRVRVDGLAPEAVADQVAAGLAAIRVPTGHPYLVRVGAGMAGAVADHLPATARRVALIADRAVVEVAERIAEALRGEQLTAVVLAVDGGEQAKRWSVAGDLLERCSDAGLERGDCLVAVGGGSIGDVAGMVAATYLRGIAWVVVPTTLLAMVDSAVGGKTAVNLRRGKNLAGAFWQPRAVLCDLDTLSTVGERSFRSAFSEIVKCSMVGPAWLSDLVDNRLEAALRRDPSALAVLVRGCCALKAEVVGGDEREAGRRAILNYGHTVGHAVEALTGYGDGLDHGEAVAFGMRVAGALSVAGAGCPAEHVAHQGELLDACGLTGAPLLRAAEITAHLGTDKKARGGVPRWVLLRRRGEPISGVVVEPEVITGALEEALAG